MAQFWKIVNEVIRESDIILEIIDSRHIELTRHEEVEDKVRRSGKTLIYVLNKCDLANKEELERCKKYLRNAVFVSAIEYHGLKKLKEKIMIEGKRLGWERIRVGVVGYPNVGKSSLINAMKGSHAARTSSNSGYTRGVQKIVKRNITYLDTPGVIPYKEEDRAKHAIIGAIDFSKIKKIEEAIDRIIETYPGKLEKKYGIKEDEDFLENLAIQKNLLKQKGVADEKRAATLVLKNWQSS